MKKILTITAFFIAPLFSFGQTASYDASLDSSYRNSGFYTMIPLHHCDTFRFGARVANVDTDTLTNVSVSVSVENFSESISLGTLAPSETSIGETSAGYLPTTTGVKNIYFNTSATETETSYANNYDTMSFEVTETVYSRDLGFADGGLGFNTGSGFIGQKFDINENDTITTISFYLNTPSTGDSCRAYLMNWNGGPGSTIDSSEVIYQSAGQNWYTARLSCPTIVNAGEYFVALEQMMAGNNLGLGYSFDNHFDSTVLYDGGAGWTAIENVAALADAILLIRVNVDPLDIDVTTSQDTICSNKPVTVSVNRSQLDYTWYPSGAAVSPNAQNTLFRLSQSGYARVVTDFGCGMSATDSVFIYIEPNPTVTLTADTTICMGESLTLQASGGSSYRWLGGPTNGDWTVTPTTRTMYEIDVDSTNGCKSSHRTFVDVSTPMVIATGDTAACVGVIVPLQATGSTTYQWVNGPSTANHSVEVNQSYYAIVQGTDDYGCVDTDSVYIEALNTPSLVPMNDTGACFTSFVTISTNSTAPQIEWSTGDTTRSITFQMLQERNLVLTARNDYGCEDHDTIFVSRYPRPNGAISPSNDTMICEKSTLPVTASGGSTYEWSTGDTTATAQLSPTEETKYSVIIRNEYGCEDYDDIVLTLDPLPTVAYKYTIHEDSVAFTSLSDLATSYRWDFGDGNTATEESTYNIYQETGTYTIVHTATNHCGDVDTTFSINVNVPKEVDNISNIAQWQDVKIYPNPTSGALFFEVNNQLYGPMEVIVMDIQGKELQSMVFDKSAIQRTGNIDLEDYVRGIYLIQFKIGMSVMNVRIQKH